MLKFLGIYFSICCLHATAKAGDFRINANLPEPIFGVVSFRVQGADLQENRVLNWFVNFERINLEQGQEQELKYDTSRWLEEGRFLIAAELANGIEVRQIFRVQKRQPQFKYHVKGLIGHPMPGFNIGLAISNSDFIERIDSWIDSQNWGFLEAGDKYCWAPNECGIWFLNPKWNFEVYALFNSGIHRQRFRVHLVNGSFFDIESDVIVHLGPSIIIQQLEVKDKLYFSGIVGSETKDPLQVTVRLGDKVIYQKRTRIFQGEYDLNDILPGYYEMHFEVEDPRVCRSPFPEFNGCADRQWRKRSIHIL